jgi:hypothetical protein
MTPSEKISEIFENSTTHQLDFFDGNDWNGEEQKMAIFAILQYLDEQAEEQTNK